MNEMKRLMFLSVVLSLVIAGVMLDDAQARQIDKMWGEQMLKLKAADAERGQLFEEGNYAMFIHWGLYSNIGNLHKGKSYYGIGEWKHVVRVWQWQQGGKASWEVNVLKPGYCNVDLTYSGTDRIVWGVDVEGGQHIQNQQNSSHNYQTFPIGWINFPKPGRYTVSVSCLEGDLAEASLKAIHLNYVD